MFRLLDDDDSGALDARELIDGLSSTGARVDPDALRALVASVDFDGSGLIELDEFVVIMSNRRQLRAFRGALRDPNRPNDDSSSSSSDDERGTAAEGFDGTWARGLRRRRMIAAAREGGAARRRLLVVGARRADARRPPSLDSRALEAAHRAELAALEARAPRASSIARRGDQSEENAASTEVLAALSRAVASSAREAGFPAMSLAFLREVGSGDAVAEAAGRAVPGTGTGTKTRSPGRKPEEPIFIGTVVPVVPVVPVVSVPGDGSPGGFHASFPRDVRGVGVVGAAENETSSKTEDAPAETAEATPEKTDARRALIARPSRVPSRAAASTRTSSRRRRARRTPTTRGEEGSTYERKIENRNTNRNERAGTRRDAPVASAGGSRFTTKLHHKSCGGHITSLVSIASCSAAGFSSSICVAPSVPSPSLSSSDSGSESESDASHETYGRSVSTTTEARLRPKKLEALVSSPPSRAPPSPLLSSLRVVVFPAGVNRQPRCESHLAQKHAVHANPGNHECAVSGSPSNLTRPSRTPSTVIMSCTMPCGLTYIPDAPSRDIATSPPSDVKRSSHARQRTSASLSIRTRRDDTSLSSNRRRSTASFAPRRRARTRVGMGRRAATQYDSATGSRGTATGSVPTSSSTKPVVARFAAHEGEHWGLAEPVGETVRVEHAVHGGGVWRERRAGDAEGSPGGSSSGGDGGLRVDDHLDVGEGWGVGHAAEVGLVHDAPHEFRLVADGETEAAARDEAHARVVAVAAGVAAGELADLGEGAEVEPGLVAVHREDAEETAEVGLGRHARLEGESRVAPVVMVEGQGYVLPGEEDVVQQDDDGDANHRPAAGLGEHAKKLDVGRRPDVAHVA